jgi:AcrR family transcriptional regulator
MQPESKLAVIQQAARWVFMQHGYAAASMDQVAARAVVSKATVYTYFASKQELFAAISAAESERYAGSLGQDLAMHGELRPRLLRLGREILDLLLDDETIAVYRMVMAEAGRIPALGQAFHSNGPAQLLLRLERFFAAAMRAGQLRVADARHAAEQFVGLIRGDLQLRALLGVSADLSSRSRNAVVRSGVDTFCRSYLQPARAAAPRRARAA